MKNFYHTSFYPDLGSTKQKYENNLKAIGIAVNNVSPTTLECQKQLALYTGWGDSRVLNLGFESYFDPEPRLKNLLDDKTIESIRRSSMNAHYTSFAIVKSIWDVLLKLGIGTLNKIKILDPSAGVGNFATCMPECLREKSDWTMIELDKLTSKILQKIRPEDTVINCGYEDSDLPNNYYDLVISNVPFGDYGVVDKQVDSKFTKSIHDYFFAKSVQKVRPGGVIAFITSRYTLDKTDTSLRRYLSRQCELIGAVRLPSTAFKQNAGTEVVTDFIVLRRRENENTRADGEWIQTQVFDGEDNVNAYFMNHPENVLGTPQFNRGLYSSHEYTVSSQDFKPELIAEAFDEQNIFAPRTQPQPQPINSDVTMTVKVEPQSEEDIELAKTLQDIFESAKALLKSQMDGLQSDQIEAKRAHLNSVYDLFKERHGHINSKRANKLLQGNFALPFLLSLEKDDGTKSDIFYQDVVNVLRDINVSTTQDGLSMCLDRLGKVDIQFIADKVNKDEQTVIEELTSDGLIYLDPQDTQWKSSDEYLSGDIKEKLAAAIAAAKANENYARNVIALENAMPEPLKPGEIIANLGAFWIAEPYIKSFIEEKIPGIVVRVSKIDVLGQWTIELMNGTWKLRSDRSWSTNRMTIIDLMLDGMNGKTPVVTDTMPDGSTQTNHIETMAAQAKLEEIRAEFASWVWQDPIRAEELAKTYNDKFNRFVPRKYNGTHLSLPGLNKEINPRQHQLNAVWRILQNKSALIGHEVGAGKTLTFILAAMEAKRLGIATKPMVVVPNHLVGQWHEQISKAYPSANVLVANKETFTKQNRSEFMSRIATNNWDLVIVAMSQFKLLPLLNETVREFIEAQIDDYERICVLMKNGRGSARAIKEVQKAIARQKVKLEKMADMKKDDSNTLSFEELGVDMLGVDEADLYKNLEFATKMSRIAGLPNSKSERAFDMFMKVRLLLENDKRVVFLTGTPVSNTIAEVYTMMRYLQPNLLKKVGLEHFDAWANSFATVQASVEMKPDGSGFRVNNRFSKFINAPELSTMWQECLDVVSADKLKLPKPNLVNGKPIVFVSPKTDEISQYIHLLSKRVEAIKKGKVDPSEDNMLLVTSDGRKAALDMRLVNPNSVATEDCKLNTVSKNIALIYNASTSVKGTQLVFLDIGTPKSKTEKEFDNESNDEPEILNELEKILLTNVYAEIKRDLVRLGIPQNEIAFIHDAKDLKSRTALFEKVRAGIIRVLIGSTEKMGAGMNVQDRLIWLHHIDVPWRPRDITQRNGRILRQGNRFGKVGISNYVTESTFDGYMWQTIESKMRFIEHITSGDVTERVVQDVSETVLNAAELKAIASGNKKIMEKCKVDADYERLSALRKAHLNQRAQMNSELNQIPHARNYAMSLVKQYTDAINARDSEKSDVYKIGIVESVTDTTLRMFDNRAKANEHLCAVVNSLNEKMRKDYGTDYVKREYFDVGMFRGFTLAVAATNDKEAPKFVAKFGSVACEFGWSNGNPLASLSTNLSNLELTKQVQETTIENLNQRETQFKNQIDIGFAHEDELKRLQVRKSILDIELDMELNETVKQNMLHALGAKLEVEEPYEPPKNITQDHLERLVKECVDSFDNVVEQEQPTTEPTPPTPQHFTEAPAMPPAITIVVKQPTRINPYDLLKVWKNGDDCPFCKVDNIASINLGVNQDGKQWFDKCKHTIYK